MRIRELTLLVDLRGIYMEHVGENAFSRVLERLCLEMGCDHGTIMWSGECGARGGVHRSAAGLYLTPQQDLFPESADTPNRDTVVRLDPYLCPVDGTSSDFAVAFRFLDGKDLLGQCVLGRDGRGFDECEMRLSRAVQAELAAYMSFRRHSRMQNQHRMLDERDREILDRFQDMIVSVDGEGIVAFMNESGARMLGYDSAKDVVGMEGKDLWFDPGQRAHFIQRLMAEGSVKDFEIIQKKRDGNPIFCLESATADLDENGRLLGLTGIIKDITPLVSVQKEMHRTNLELQEVNRKLRDTQVMVVQQEKLASIGQLAAGIAHEINNPLSFLKSNATAMKDYMKTLFEYHRFVDAQNLPPIAARREALGIAAVESEIHGIIKESDEGFDRIIEIVRNLRNFARIDSMASLEWFDVNQGIRNTIAIAWNEIKYSAEAATNLGAIPLVLCNGGEINQVILNLLMNAVQAIETKEGRSGLGHITVRTWQEGDRVFCEIEDDGPGIPLEIQNRIFEPFFTTKPPGKGTGLGLSISYDIVSKKHNGSFQVRSEPGKGATFTFSLPLTPDAGKP